MTVREREVNRIPDDLGEFNRDIATGAANLDQWLAKERDAICRGLVHRGWPSPALLGQEPSQSAAWYSGRCLELLNLIECYRDDPYQMLHLGIQLGSLVREQQLKSRAERDWARGNKNATILRQNQQQHNRKRSAAKQREWAACEAEIDRLILDHPAMSNTSIAENVAKKLKLRLAIRTIRGRVAKRKLAALT